MIYNNLYKNKGWLYQKYIIEKLSTPKIAKICECNHKTICDWLKRHNIKTRTRSEARIGKLHPRYCPLEERLWKYVDKKDNISECWPWIAYKTLSGHGRIGNGNGNQMSPAHAIMYEIFYKDKVEKGEVIHHLCETPSCCNPHHLVKMTKGEHTSLHNKGNNRGKGEKNGNVKLTWEKVKNIRAEYDKTHCSYVKLGRKYMVHSDTIGLIIRNKAWVEK